MAAGWVCNGLICSCLVSSHGAGVYLVGFRSMVRCGGGCNGAAGNRAAYQPMVGGGNALVIAITLPMRLAHGAVVLV